MKFKPVTDKYKFDPSVLTRDFPSFLRTATESWLFEVLDNVGALDHFKRDFEADFINELSLTLRLKFPTQKNNFFALVFSEPDLAANMIALCLQNYATVTQAEKIEEILAKAGSAYSVIFVESVSSSFDKGNADLVERVPTIIREASESAINGEVQLREAWASCYSVNPDYEKTVSKCCDVLEKIWRDKYFPKDPTPNIAKFVASFKTDASKLSYKGSSIADPKNLLTNLAEKFSSIRGQHTAGTGRAPTKEEAEFVLHYSIFVWNSER